MEYRYWHRSGGGKNGKDPVYYFTLESGKPSSTGVAEEASAQIEALVSHKSSFEAKSQERIATLLEKPKQHSQTTVDTMDLAAADELAKYQATSLKAAPNADVPPRHCAPLVPTGIRNINDLSVHDPSDLGDQIFQQMTRLILPDPSRPLVRTHTITCGTDTPRLGLRIGFIKPLVEDTLGFPFTKDLSFKVRLLIERNGRESVFEHAVVSTKKNYLSTWRKILSLLGGAEIGDDLIFTYKGKVQEGNQYFYYFTLKKQSYSGDEEGDHDNHTAAENLDAANEDEKSDISIGDLLKELEDWNKKYDEDSPASPLAVAAPRVEKKERKPDQPLFRYNPQLLAPRVEKKEEIKPQQPLFQNSPRQAAPSLPVAPTRRPDGPEPLKSRPFLCIQDARFLKASSLTKSASPSLASTEPNEVTFVEEGATEIDSLQPRKKRSVLERLKPRKFSNLRPEVKHVSVLKACADEINALESLMGSVRDSAPADTVKTKDSLLLSMHRHRLAKHFVDSGIASEMRTNLNGIRNVFMDSKGGLLANMTYKEQSLWCGDNVGSLKEPLLDDLRQHGAFMSHSLRRVLMGQWPFKRWVGDMNNRDLLPAGVGVVALEDIPAGSFVSQFIGQYISWGALPGPSLELYTAYCEEEAEFEYSMKEENDAQEGGSHDGENLRLMQTQTIDPHDEMHQEKEEDQIEESQGARTGSKSAKSLWLGNLSLECTEDDLSKVFSRYGEVASLMIGNRSKGRPYAFVNFKTATAGEEAIADLKGAALPSVTGEQPLLIEFQKTEKKNYGASFGNDDGDDLIEGSMYHCSRGSEASKRYRVHMARGTECVVPAAAAKTYKQKNLVDELASPYGSNISINNDQWRRLNTTIISAGRFGNATYFMRLSEKNFNLARVQLNVPNGPTKILYYAKRDIVKGEELVRER